MSPPPPSIDPSGSAENAPAGSDSWASKLERNVIWLVLTAMVAGAVGAMAVWSFFRSEVKSAIDDEVKSQLSKGLGASAIPKGAFLLFATACPEADWDDVSASFHGRYIYVDQNVTNGATIVNADGSHAHTGGAHPHTTVTGVSSKLGEGERSGTQDQRHAAHKDNTVTFTGAAAPDGSAHTHDGGVHDHNRISLRLCKKR